VSYYFYYPVRQEWQLKVILGNTNSYFINKLRYLGNGTSYNG